MGKEITPSRRNELIKHISGDIYTYINTNTQFSFTFNYDDLDIVQTASWNSNNGYPFRCLRFNGKRRGEYFHKILSTRLGFSPNLLVDHKDQNRTNNTRLNLREATARDNRLNSDKSHGKYSLYKGVSYHKRCMKWYASIKIKCGKQKHLGSFDTEIEAAIAYNEAVERNGSEFQRKNIIL